MTAHANDEQYMRRALALATETAALASPNPQVGCVLVSSEGAVIGEGAHRYAGFDHAEIVALKAAAAAGHSTAGATAYVTLEPCSHHGRTGPCADALVGAGIARAVVATVDPNPAVSGRGIAKLHAAGIATTIGVCQSEARSLNDAFAFAIQNNRPFVTLKAALSVDGKLAPTNGPAPGQPHWLTGPAAREEVQRLRHASDAILTGIGTVLADDPSLTDRTGLPRRRPLLRVVVDSQLRTPAASQLIQTARVNAFPEPDLLLLCSEDASADREAALRTAAEDRIEVLRLPSSHARLEPHAVLAELTQRKCISVLLEAGSTLNGAFLAADLVDRAVLFYAETELGPDALPFAQGQPSPFLLQQRLIRATNTTFGPPERPDVCIAGLLHDPWPAD